MSQSKTHLTAPFGYTACGRRLSDVRFYVSQRENVTCKDCLNHPKVHTENPVKLDAPRYLAIVSVSDEDADELYAVSYWAASSGLVCHWVGSEFVSLNEVRKNLTPTRDPDDAQFVVCDTKEEAYSLASFMTGTCRVEGYRVEAPYPVYREDWEG